MCGDSDDYITGIIDDLAVAGAPRHVAEAAIIKAFSAGVRAAAHRKEALDDIADKIVTHTESGKVWPSGRAKPMIPRVRLNP